ncbi:MAG: PAS domain-containing sensor histidine kinase [Deltaproteobacteria bacterium]|nr:PAS domain-containing sensor histidine kinase [Deltaproteobacteria bacterium]
MKSTTRGSKPAINSPANNLEQITDSLLDGLLVVNRKGQIEFLNPAAAKIFGKTKEALRGEEFGFPLSHGEITEIEIFSKGSSLAAEMAVGEDLQWNGRPAYAVSVRDITHKRHLQESKEKERILEEHNHILSHEIKNPLAILQAALSNLIDPSSENLTKKQQRICTIMQSSIERMKHVLGNALMLARLEQEDVRAHQRFSELHILLTNLVHEFQPIAKQEKLKLMTEIPQQAPSVWIVEDLISQVILNLLQNSLRYAKTKLWVKMASISLKGKRFLEARIGNDGDAIAPEDQKKLFQKFVHLPNKQKRGPYQGTGLGLALCKLIIEKHGGSINVDSNPKTGTTFSFRLPEKAV